LGQGGNALPHFIYHRRADPPHQIQANNFSGSNLIILFSRSVAINLGLPGFAQSLEDQVVEVVQVDWSPPAGGDQEMIDFLDNLL
jgi:hypothetical protein